MGSWNSTCMVTGLPIAASAPVVGFIIATRPYGSGHGSTFSASPVSLPIFGEYDTYGRINPDPEAEVLAEVSLAWLRTKVSEIIDYEYQHGTPIHDPSAMPLSDWVTLAERASIRDDQGIYVQFEYESSPLRLQFCLIHRFAYDWVLTQGYDIRKEEVLIPFMELSPVAYRVLGAVPARNTSLSPEARNLAYEAFQFSSGLEAMRGTWRAYAGGDQEEPLERYAALFRESLEYIKKRTQEIESWDSDQYELDFGPEYY